MATMFTEVQALERVLCDHGYTNEMVVLVIETSAIIRLRESPPLDLGDTFVKRALSALDAQAARHEVERTMRRRSWLRSRLKMPRPPMVERRRARVCALSSRYRALP